MRHQSTFRFFIWLFVIAVISIIYAVYQQALYVKKEREDFIHNYVEEDTNIDFEKAGKLFINHRMYLKNIYKIKARIRWFNMRQRVVNMNLGPITNGTYVIVIQCHSNVYHLQQLLNSLSKACFINSALLIFSHDHYSYTINKVIEKTVNFAKYIQIFYPYSMQIHPNVFPGAEPKSCVDGFQCVKTSGRDPEAAQAKHHWWWQANQIFDHLKILKNFTEPILFLEEDNYVTEDVLVIFKMLLFAKNIHCPFCEMISLAAHNPELGRYTRRKSIVSIEAWTETKPRTAIAFDRGLWETIKQWKELFCYYNDSNWDNSLKHLGAEKWDGNIYLIAIDGPRVFRLEKCDEKDVGCQLQHKVGEVQKFIQLISKQLYPLSIKIKVMAEDDFNSTAAGLWNDVRDHELCLHFTKQSVWY